MLRSFLSTSAALVVLGTASLVHADEDDPQPRRHPDYSVEIEPHFVIGDLGTYEAGGYGVGARFGIPIVRNGFVPSINNNVAINFGVDLVHYGCYLDNVSCSANYLLFPVALQWNFFFSHSWSAYGEAGLFLFKGFYDNACVGNICAGGPSDLGALPTFAVGGRYHFNEHVALNLRIGYPPSRWASPSGEAAPDRAS